MSGNYRKRPCRICRKWYKPSARGGHHQKTCGRDECRQRWHRKKCAQWRKDNPDYHEEIRVCRAMDQLNQQPTVDRKEINRMRYPRALGQEVIGVKESLFIEVILKLLYKRVQEVNRTYLSKNARDP